MVLKILPRSTWGARPAKKFTASDPKKLKGVVIHWFAKPRSAHDHKDCPALLRAVQRAHQAGEFSDIAYNHLVCQHGVVYTGRGFGRQTGANGNRTVNRTYGAVCAMIGEGDKPSGELKQALAEVIAEWRKRGAGSMVVRHGEITGSACPGPELSTWVNVKGYEVKKLPAKARKPKPLPEPLRVDVSAGTVTITNQDPDNPVVRSRLRRLLNRFGSLTIRKSK